MNEHRVRKMQCAQAKWEKRDPIYDRRRWHEGRVRPRLTRTQSKDRRSARHGGQQNPRRQEQAIGTAIVRERAAAPGFVVVRASLMDALGTKKRASRHDSRAVQWHTTGAGRRGPSAAKWTSSRTIARPRGRKHSTRIIPRDRIFYFGRRKSIRDYPTLGHVARDLHMPHAPEAVSVRFLFSPPKHEQNVIQHGRSSWHACFS